MSWDDDDFELRLAATSTARKAKAARHKKKTHLSRAKATVKGLKRGPKQPSRVERASASASRGAGVRGAKKHIKLRVGSLCSGYNAPYLALERLGLDSVTEEVFACDVDPKVRKVLLRNFHDLTRANVFGDIMKLNAKLLAGSCGQLDILTAGFPCQPFSMLGRGLGTSDSRGTVIWKVIELIRNLAPKAFILENVEGMIKSHWNSFMDIMSALRKIRVDGTTYKVTWEILNSRMVSGMAQNRPRLYIVGICNKYAMKPFAWPAAVPMKPLSSFLDPPKASAKKLELKQTKTVLRNYLSLAAKIKASGKDLRGNFIGDLESSASFGGGLTDGYSPCLTRTRCGSRGYFVFSRGRPMTTAEMFRLQGVPAGRIKAPLGVTERAIRMMIGNSNDVMLYARLLSRVLTALGHRTEDPLGCEESVDANFETQ